MRTPAATLATLATTALLGALALSGCSSDAEPVAEPAPASSEVPSSSPTASPSASPTAEPSPASPTPSDAAPSPTEEPTQEQTREPSVEPSATPTAAPTRSGAQRGLRAARADARVVAPRLKTFFDEREYPVDLGQLRSILPETGVSLGAGNTIGGYGLSGDGTDFVLCIQHDGGGWASWNTAVGKVDDAGAEGACPGSADAG